METRILTTSDEDIRIAAEIIKAGGLVAFPTETVYGLGANALDTAAVQKIYAAKGRPGDNPMIVHIAAAKDLSRLTFEVTGAAKALADSFWPGPLTIVVKKKPEVPDAATGGLPTVAVRMPDDPTALKLIEWAGCPIAAPSANISGKPSPTKPAHVISDMEGKIDAIIAGGNCRVGIESTVIDLSFDIPVILRPGMVTAKDIKAACGISADLDRSLLSGRPFGAASDFKPKSPGMKYKHYAPRAEMTIIEGQRDKVRKEIDHIKNLNEIAGKRVGVILFDETAAKAADRDLYAKLRELDDSGADIILAGAVKDADGTGFAVMNRMLLAAGHKVLKV